MKEWSTHVSKIERTKYLKVICQNLALEDLGIRTKLSYPQYSVEATRSAPAAATILSGLAPSWMK